jgi:PAS domain S-box-containing protein
MIWESSLLMTLIDLTILSVALASAWLLLQQKHKLLQVKAFLGSTFIMVGLSAIGLFYGMDLFTMHVLPLYSTSQDALATMADLHLNYSWLVVLFSTLCVFVGFYWINHNFFSLIDQLILAQGNLEREFSEHRTTQKVLKRSEEQFRLLVDGTQDYGIFLLDPEGKILSWNLGAERIKGYKEWEIVGRHFSYFYPPEEIAKGKPEKELEIARTLGRVEDKGWRLRKDGSRFWANVIITALHDDKGQIRGFSKITRDLTEQRQAEWNLETREQQQAAVAELGQYALIGVDLQSLMEEVVRRLTKILNVEYSKILELLPEGKDFHLRAGVGWKPGLVGVSTVSGERNSQAGYTLLSDEPVVVEDLRAETRFDGPPLLHDHGVVSGISVIIHGKKNRPYGVLGVHSIHQRSFSVEDINFLKAVANVLAAAIERKRAETAIRESEEMTRQVLEAIADMVVVKGPGSRILWANKAFRDYYGMTNTQLHELIDAPFNDPNYTDQYLEDDRKVFATGETCYITQEPVTRYDGEVRLFNTAKSPIFDEEGHVKKLVAVIRDITESKHAEETLQELDIALKLATPGISLLDLEGRYIEVNDEYANLLGYSPVELIGRPWHLTIHPEDRPKAETAIKDMWGKGKGEFEARAIRKDGSVFFEHIVMVKYTNQKKGPERYHCFMRDISENRALVETMRQNKIRLEHLLTASPAVIYTCIVNEPFAATFISQNITHQLGYEPEDFITHEEFWANHIHPEDTQRTLAEFLHVLEKGRLTLEYRFLHKNGTYRWMHDELTLVRDSEGHPLELIGYWIDITERKKAEEEIAAAYAQLRQLTRQLGMAEEKERKRIARELHDEFGQTLAGLKFDLSKLSKQLIQELPAQSIVGYHSQFKSMTNTVDTAIHSMRRIATDLRPSLLDDLGLVAALEWLLQSFQARTSIVCTLTVSPDVSTLVIDPERSSALFRIIQELLTNVLKHAGASKVTITITLEDGTLALAFTDDGRGVTKEELAHTTSLGLVGIKERLAVFDGQLTIQGDPDKGTCVGIQIPLTPAPTPVA